MKHVLQIYNSICKKGDLYFTSYIFNQFFLSVKAMREILKQYIFLI